MGDKYYEVRISDGADSSEIKRLIEQMESLGAVFKAKAQPPESAADGFDVPRMPDGRPRLWAERTTGREVSPADFIRKYYGQTREDGTWDAMGLTRKTLRQFDDKLESAYATYINRHPATALSIPAEPHTRRPAELTLASKHSFWVPTADLNPEEKEGRRIYEALKKRQQRARAKDPKIIL